MVDELVRKKKFGFFMINVEIYVVFLYILL